jgi:hypothetical protein
LSDFSSLTLSHYSTNRRTSAFNILTQAELALKIFKIFKLEVNTLFLALDMLRRISIYLSLTGEEGLSEQAKFLAGPLCMSLSCKYNIRSTFTM